MKNFVFTSFLTLSLCSCSWLYWDSAQGQIIYHWERPNTGIEKFARDHSECMRKAEGFHVPDFRSWFFSEEVKLDLRANWHADRGIWASYVAYPGAQPVLVRSMRENDGSSPRKYRVCMEDRGYQYKPQRVMQDLPFVYESF